MNARAETATHWLAQYHGLPAYLLALAGTLALAAWLTPRTWWRRPNLGALTVLLIGCWGIGGLLLPAPQPGAGQAAALANANANANKTFLPVPRQPARPYYVYRDLNLRAGPGVNSTLLGTVPSGSTVLATGERRGDWWRVDVELAGRRQQGWASSLWLRQPDEALAVSR